MLTRYKGQIKLKDWAFAIAKRSTMRKARVALARRLEIIMHAMLRDGTEFAAGSAINPPDRRPHRAPKRSDALGREQTTARILLHAACDWPTAISTEPPCTQLTPSSAERARRERRHPQSVDTQKSLPPLTHRPMSQLRK